MRTRAPWTEPFQHVRAELREQCWGRPDAAHPAELGRRPGAALGRSPGSVPGGPRVGAEPGAAGRPAHRVRCARLGDTAGARAGPGGPDPTAGVPAGWPGARAAPGRGGAALDSGGLLARTEDPDGGVRGRAGDGEGGQCPDRLAPDAGHGSGSGPVSHRAARRGRAVPVPGGGQSAGAAAPGPPAGPVRGSRWRPG